MFLTVTGKFRKGMCLGGKDNEFSFGHQVSEMSVVCDSQCLISNVGLKVGM